MGGGASKPNVQPKKNVEVEKKEIVRRDPLDSVEDILKNDEAKSRVLFAVQQIVPGSKSRWDKITQMVNKDGEDPTEQDPDPVRFVLDVTKVKIIVRRTFEATTSVPMTDGLKQMQSLVPNLYKTHSYDRGLRISIRERNELKITEEGYAYGELDIETFADLFLKVAKVYGSKKGGTFYDLGCGVGQLVYAAAAVGDFRKCVGIEILKSLFDRGEKRKSKWASYMEDERMLESIKLCDVSFVNGDIFENVDWLQATFLFIHWTAVPRMKLEKLFKKIEKLAEGTICIAITNPIPNPCFEVLLTGEINMSWGEAEYYLQEKMTPSKIY